MLTRLGRARIGSHLFVVLQVFIRKPETVQTVKLTLNHRPKPMSVDMQMLIHRKDQTAHISLQLPSISKSQETKRNWMRPIFSARPASFTSYFILRRVAVWPVWRPVVAVVCASAPPVKGCLRIPTGGRKCFFS